MKISQFFMAALIAGCTTAGGYNLAEQPKETQEIVEYYSSMFHTEYFVATVVDGEGFYGEPTTKTGKRISGEGVALDIDWIPAHINEGDIVAIAWTSNQAENSDWETPASVEQVRKAFKKGGGKK